MSSKESIIDFVSKERAKFLKDFRRTSLAGTCDHTDNTLDRFGGHAWRSLTAPDLYPDAPRAGHTIMAIPGKNNKTYLVDFSAPNKDQIIRSVISSQEDAAIQAELSRLTGANDWVKW
jgi:hypothetical protein